MELATNLVGGYSHQPETKFLRLVKEEPVGFPNPATARVAVISASFVRRYFGDENPLGKHIKIGKADAE